MTEQTNPTAEAPVQKPSIGRIVHAYRSGSTEPTAAMVTSVNPGNAMMVNVRLFLDPTAPEDALDGLTSVEYSKNAEGAAFYWTWPPRV